jgi:serine/threonine protein kinase
VDNKVAKKACLACRGEFDTALNACPNDGTALVTLDSDDLTGTTLDGRYEILQVVGSGGMGTVYRATQKFINRTVAVKVLRKGSITNAEILQRFQMEAQAASKLSNPHIVAVFDSNVSPNGEPYMVMDFLEGESLDDTLKRSGRLSAARAIPIFMQACDALNKAHIKGIVHRDIKPSNIMLVKEDNEDDFVKLVDFGIAKMLQVSEKPQLTRTGEIFGSPLYMSPEQWRGSTVDARADIYSLGAVMYQTLAGVPVFHGNDVLQLAFKHGQDLPEPLRTHGVSIPERLEAAIVRALAKEPDERFQTMRDLKQELTEIHAALTPADSQVQTMLASLAQNASAQGSTHDDKTLVRNTSEQTQAWLQELAPAHKKSTDLIQGSEKAAQTADSTLAKDGANTGVVSTTKATVVKFAAIAFATTVIASMAVAGAKILFFQHTPMSSDSNPGLTPPATPSSTPSARPSRDNLPPANQPSAQIPAAAPIRTTAPMSPQRQSEPVSVQHREGTANMAAPASSLQTGEPAKPPQAREPENWQVVPNPTTRPTQTAQPTQSAQPVRMSQLATPAVEPATLHHKEHAVSHKKQPAAPDHGITHKLKQLLHKL